MDPFAAALARLVARSETERLDLERLRALAARTDPWSRSEPLHATASALVIDRATERVLLRWHVRLGRWLQVGGHGDLGERDPWVVACREAREETGLEDLVALTPALERQPLQVVIVAVPARGEEPAHEHADIRYLLATDTPERAAPERPDAPLRWVALAEAASVVGEENLSVLLERVRPILASAHEDPDARR